MSTPAKTIDDCNRGKMEKTKRKLKIFIIFCLVASASGFVGLLIGMKSGSSNDKLFTTIRRIQLSFIAAEIPKAPDTNEFRQLILDAAKIQVDTPRVTDKTIVAFVFGQSNSANFSGERHYAQTENVLNYFDGRYYIAADPLLGASGLGGTMWTITANKLIQHRIADNAVLIAAGVAGTSMKQWRGGTELHKMVEERLKDTKRNNIPVTHFLWHQGESDNDSDALDYRKGLEELINLTATYYPDSKFFVSQASACYPKPSSSVILKVQADITQLNNVYIGPNTDLISVTDRYDGCHLSGRGIEKVAKEWVELIKNPKKSAITNYQ
jgi:hypothetical protein